MYFYLAKDLEKVLESLMIQRCCHNNHVALLCYCSSGLLYTGLLTCVIESAGSILSADIQCFNTYRHCVFFSLCFLIRWLEHCPAHRTLWLVRTKQSVCVCFINIILVLVVFWTTPLHQNRTTAVHQWTGEHWRGQRVLEVHLWRS